MSGYAQPLWSIQVAFASNPLAATPTWTEISQLVQSGKTTRGRQHVLGTMEPGRLTLTCWDQNRALDTSNTASPYYPNVDINKRIRVGIVVNALTVAQSAITGGWTAGANTTATFPAGTMQLQATASGSIIASTPSGTAGFRVMAGVSYYATIAAKANTTVRTVTPSIAWYSQDGTLLSTSTLTGFSDTTGSFAVNTQTVTSPAGAFYAAITETVAGCAGSEIHTLDNAGLIDTRVVASNAWVAGNGDNPVPLFTGFIDAISPVWKSQMRNYVTIRATDTLRILQQTKMPVDPYVAQATANGASYIWPLADPVGSTTLVESISGQTGSLKVNAPGLTLTLGSAARASSITATTLHMTEPAPINNQSASFTTPASAFPTGSGDWTIEMWAYRAVGSADVTMLQSSDATSSSGVIFDFQNAGGSFCDFIVFNAGATLGLTASVNPSQGAWHLFRGERRSGSYNFYIDGVLVATSAHAVITLNTPTSVSWCIPLPSGPPNADILMSCATIYASGAASVSAPSAYTAGIQWFTTPETSTARMVDALQIVSFPASLYAVAGSGSDSGQSQIQAPASAPTTAKSYLDAVAQAENGIIYARCDGVVVALDRYHQINANPTITFGDNGTTEIPYQVDPQLAKDNIDLFNASTCQAVNGNPQTTVGTTSTQYGVTASLDETNLIAAGGDIEMLARSQWNVNRYQSPQMRIRAIDVDCLAHLSLTCPPLLASQPQQTVEIGRQVNVNRRPLSTAMSSLGFGNPTFSQASMVEGIEHQFSFGPTSWHMTLHLSPADTAQYWVLGTSALDTGTRLAY